MKMQTDDPRRADKVIEDVFETARRTYRESTDAITALARETDAESLFITVASLLSYAPAELIGEIERGDRPAKVELLAFLLYPQLGVSATKPDFNQVNNCLDLLDKASLAGSNVMMFEDFERRRFDPLDHLQQRVRIHARFVRDSAYPEQTAEEIQMIQGKFGTHFQRQSGISPSRALAITWAILEEQERKINVIIPQAFEVGRSYELLWEEAKSIPPRSRTPGQEYLVSIAATRKVAAYIGYLRHMASVLPEAIPVAAKELRRVGPPPSHEEWDALIGLVGMTAKRREQYSEPQQIQFSPLFVLGDHRVLLNGLTCAVDALWYAYDRVARKDHVFFDGPYQKTKSKWLEDKVYESLTRIFPAASVFRNVFYPDPEKGGAATAELDFLISWPPFLLIVEAKSHQFKEESQLGDMHKLRRDLKSNLEKAFTQARRAREYFESNQIGRFCEKSSERVLLLESNRIRKTYLVSVSLHELAGLATNLASLRDLGLFGDGEYPFATCCADLELISRFAKSPDVFLHYLERRLDILHKPPQVAGDEMDMFGAYLECRLQEDVLFPKGGKPLSWVGLDGFSEPFDKWMMYKRDDIHEKPTIELKVPEIVRAILDCLRKDAQNESARWISFALLGFSDRMLNAIDKSIQEIRASTLTPGMFRRVAFEEEGVVVSIVASMDQTAEALRERTEMRAVTEKYRRRAGKSIGLGILLNTQRSPIDCALWIEGPWEYDETLEKVLEHEPVPVLLEGQTLPGRNEPCFCGSRKKFKKCCLSKMSRH